MTMSGVARLEFDGDGRRWETWRGRGVKADVVTVSSTRRRIRLMLAEILSLIPREVDLSVVEGPSFGSRTAMSLADERSGLRWMLIDQLFARGPVVVVSPKTRALLACGNGNAGKADVLAAVQAGVPDAHVPDDNVADAVALAIAGAHRLGMPASYDVRQRRAFDKVAWPEVAAT